MYSIHLAEVLQGIQEGVLQGILVEVLLGSLVVGRLGSLVVGRHTLWMTMMDEVVG